MLLDMWWIRSAIELLGSAGAARNAAAAIEAHRNDLAEVDSVVARLQLHAAAERPAA
jgi:hypothetical protein